MAVKKNFNLEETIRQYEELSSIPEVVETSFRKMDRKANERYAKEKGLAEGRAEGRIESKKEIAQNLLKQKISIHFKLNK